jgi:hypothetical protein
MGQQCDWFMLSKESVCQVSDLFIIRPLYGAQRSITFHDFSNYCSISLTKLEPYSNHMHKVQETNYHHNTLQYKKLSHTTQTPRLLQHLQLPLLKVIPSHQRL